MWIVDKCEQESWISSIEKELEMLDLQTEQLSKKTSLREKQLEDLKKQTKQEEQSIKMFRCWFQEIQYSYFFSTFWRESNFVIMIIFHLLKCNPKFS